MLIPRTFHQIWLGSKPLPEAHADYRQSWLDHHPGWELRLWTEADLPSDLRRPEAAERLRTPAERSSILRLELLWRFGGVYVDTDFECLRPIEPLIEDAVFFIGRSKPGCVHNALFGSIAGHPILDRALDEVQPREFYGYQAEAGPKLLAPIIDAHGDEVLFLEPGVLHPKTIEARREAHAVHHRARSWKDAELLAPKVEQALAKASRWRARYEEATEKANHWRARCKQAEAELHRLQRSWPQRLSQPVRTRSRKGLS